MPQITKLKAQKRSNRVNLYLDGEYATSLDLITVTKLGLKVGMDISSNRLEKLVSRHQFEKLYSKAIHFLSYRPRSEKEIITFLQKKWRLGTTKEQYQRIIKKIIVKLKRQGLINDQEFTNWWINQRLEFRPRGKRLLELELRQKGIDRKIVEAALAKLDDYEIALKILKKKMKTIKKFEFEIAQLKLKSLLQRRGFDWEIVKRVVDELNLQE